MTSGRSWWRSCWCLRFGRRRGDTAAANDTLELTRLFKAPRERVFAALTTPEYMNQWFGCGGKVTTRSTDFRVGGGCRLDSRAPEGGEPVIVTGVYREIEPPAKVVFTWKYEGDAMSG